MQANWQEALIRRAVDAFNSGDIETFVEIWHPDAVAYGDPQVAERSTYHGPEGIRAWVAEARSRWISSRFAFHCMELHGELAFSEIDLIGETEAGGAAWRLAFLMSFRDGKLFELHTFTDRGAALAALPGASTA